MTDPRLRTALIAHPGAELYGSDRVMLETVAALLERGWRVVVALPASGPLVSEALALGAEVLRVDVPVLRKRILHPLRLPAFLFRSLLAAREIDLTLWRIRPDIVYVSTLTLPLWTARARAQHVPVLVHVHESERQAPMSLRRALALPLALADRVVVNSAFSRTSLLQAAPRLASRSTVVYNGVAGPSRVAESRPALDDGLRVVYLGRLSPRKGVDVAIDALHGLVAGGVPASLDLVGGVFPGYEWYEQQLRAQVARLGLEDRVRFHGFQPEVWTALGQADVAVVPSRLDEPFGNTAVEAVLAGRPVVISAIGGLTEAVDGFTSALAAAPGDASSLAAALRRVADHWSAFRRTATAMAPIAARRYATDTYRDAVAGEIARTAGVETGPFPIPARSEEAA
jgi:glycosyltransferase involved in cell wall biosynthesis